MTTDENDTIELILEEAEEARLQIAEMFDRIKMNPIIGAVALATLLHQVKHELEEDEHDFVETLSSSCTKAVDVAIDLDRIYQEVMH